MDTETIRAAVTARHGGMADASDQELLRFWRSLDAGRRRRYLGDGKAESRSSKPEGNSSRSGDSEAAQTGDDDDKRDG